MLMLNLLDCLEVFLTITTVNLLSRVYCDFCQKHDLLFKPSFVDLSGMRYKIARNFVKKQLPILSSEPIVAVTKYSQADVRLYWFVFHQSTIDQHFDRIRMLLRSLTFNVPLFFPFCYLSQLTYTGYVRS